MVYELRRTTYMKTLKLLSKIEENREIIFDKNFFHQMKECSLEMEVYASKSIAQKFGEKSLRSILNIMPNSKILLF